MRIIACWVILASSALPSVKVVPFVPQECSSRVQIIAALDGKRLRGAKLDFYGGFNVDTTHTRPVFSVSTNDAGIAVPPKLPSGNYIVFASFEGVRSAIFNESARTILYLHVLRKSPIRTISVDLTTAAQQVRQADADFKQQLDTSGEIPKPEGVQTFRGSVLDPSRAPVTSVKVSVMQKALGIWTTRVRTVSDASGQFSADLEDGRYVAVFSASGFRIAIVPFEVTSAGSGDLKIMLQIGAATE